MQNTTSWEVDVLAATQPKLEGPTKRKRKQSRKASRRASEGGSQGGGKEESEGQVEGSTKGQIKNGGSSSDIRLKEN